ncbi:MAG TPA: helix-turn-helix transcriptional regulator, partial [Thermomicrobiales bacterium]|nr:helix-turn-helix transcriptional regulator [Thermomicrobiales bacterium]
LALWSAVGAVAEEALLDVVERAVAAHLLAATPDGAGVRFVHALVREALYEGVLPPRRRAWHGRIAEALVGAPAPAGAPPDPDAVAYQFQQAGDPRAAEWLVQAGERAQAAYAWLTAAARYEAALAVLEARGAAARERGWLLFRLARMRRFADPRRGLGYLEEASRLATASGDPVLAAHALGMRGLLACLGGELRRGLADLEAGVAAFDALPALPDLQQAPADIGEGMAPTFRSLIVLQQARIGRLAEAQAAALGPRADATTARAWADLDPAGVTLMHEAVATIHAALGRPREARRAFAQARAGRRAAGHHYQVGLVALHELQAVVLPYQADQLAERQTLAAEAEAAWNRARTVRPELPPRLIRLPLLLVEGAWAEVPTLARPVLEGGGRGAYAPQFLVGTLGRLLYARGEGDLVWRLVQEVLPAGPATAPGDTLFAPALTLQGLAAALALDAGDPPTARAWLECHDRWLNWSGAVLGRAEGALGWAAYHRAAGDLTAARDHAEAALAHAAEPRQPLALLAAHRLLGELAAATGEHAAAAAHLAEALALADACAAPYERALPLLALAELRAATGAHETAGSTLAEARAILGPLDAKPALDRAAALAARLAAPAPAPTPPAPPAYPAGLTAREVEVLRLVARGLTDAQVAERLFLSPHTIGAHLRAIYGKLGVTTRSAATRFALEHRLA